MARSCSTDKRYFKNRGDALNHMRGVPTILRLKNVYKCPNCSGWHMTSNSRHGGKLSRIESRVSMDEIRDYALELRREQLADPSAFIPKANRRAVAAR